MRRTLLKLTIAVFAVTALDGCAAGPQPMTVLMPTYSFNRDVMDSDSGAAPIKADIVAAAEP